jgi:acetyltransferase-like isoleucine patch superfamily enzyme
MNPRKRIRDAQSGPLALVKSAYRMTQSASLGGPHALWAPVWEGLRLARTTAWRAQAALFVAPMYRGFCKEIGAGFSTGIYLPFVAGRGDVIIGDHVSVYGKADFHFGATLDAIPRLEIGSHSVVGHNSSFSVSGHMVIGEHCLIASGVSFADCNGHSIAPDKRLAHLPPEPQDVRNVTIGKNVWIGAGAHILPGATIGDGAIIAAHARVRGEVPPAHMVLPADGKIVPIRSDP